MTGFVAAVSENSRLDAGHFPAYNRYFEGDLRVVALSFSCRGLEFRVFGLLWASINQHKAKDIRDRAEKIKSLQKRLAEARADSASLVAQNEKLREEFDDQRPLHTACAGRCRWASIIFAVSFQRRRCSCLICNLRGHDQLILTTC